MLGLKRLWFVVVGFGYLVCTEDLSLKGLVLSYWLRAGMCFGLIGCLWVAIDFGRALLVGTRFLPMDFRLLCLNV